MQKYRFRQSKITAHSDKQKRPRNIFFSAALPNTTSPFFGLSHFCMTALLKLSSSGMTSFHSARNMVSLALLHFPLVSGDFSDFSHFLCCFLSFFACVFPYWGVCVWNSLVKRKIFVCFLSAVGFAKLLQYFYCNSLVFTITFLEYFQHHRVRRKDF